MSENILEQKDGVAVTRFCGPETLGEDRTCYQIDDSEKFVTLSRANAVEVAKAILVDSGYSLAGLFRE